MPQLPIQHARPVLNNRSDFTVLRSYLLLQNYIQEYVFRFQQTR
jgi:hypothetical protein